MRRCRELAKYSKSDAGANTTPSVGSPFSISAMLTVNCPVFLMNSLVPSRGSTSQKRFQPSRSSVGMPSDSSDKTGMSGVSLLQRGDDAVVRGAVGLSEWRVVFFGLDLGWAVVGFHDRLTGLGGDPSDVVYHFKKSYPAHAGELGQEVFSDSRIFALLECRPVVAVIDLPCFSGSTA